MGEALCVKNLCKTYVANKRQNNVLKSENFTIMEGRSEEHTSELQSHAY